MNSTLQGKKVSSVHFVGVSGIGMSAAAEISLASGNRVSGSALEQNELTRSLLDKGLVFTLGHSASNVSDFDIVVVSAAVPEDNVEVIEAKRRGIPVYLYAEYLGMLMDEREGVAVAGTHGKTTTTAMMATITHHAGLSPTVVCGGVMSEFGSNALVGSGELFIAEACEYKRSFLYMPKRYAIVTNIEEEHLDYYSGIDEIKEVFTSFVQDTHDRGFVCANGDDGVVCEILQSLRGDTRLITVGHGAGNRYRIESQSHGVQGYRFTIHGEGFRDFTAFIPIPGVFNVMNASLAAVCSRMLGIGESVIRSALEQFKGTGRRLELLRQDDHLWIYSDYAHHPTEIEATLQALKERHPQQTLTLVFQPHQYSRTSHFFKEFVDVLQGADRLVLTEVYRQRDKEGAELLMNSEILYRELRRDMSGRIVLVHNRNSLHSYLHAENSIDGVVVFMGAGDIDDVARTFAARS
jgi:UDP-N-acetylmuramate--alanine ligase